MADKNYGFSTALEKLKKGERVSRTGWNGKHMFLFLSSGGQEVSYNTSSGVAWGGFLLPFIVMRTAQGQFVPWLASQTDILAEDWEDVE